MSQLVAEVRAKIPESCVRRRCKGSGCSASLDGLPSSHILIGMDCKRFDEFFADGSRCDFVYVDEHEGMIRIVPIELKSGDFEVSKVEKQLQAGVRLAERWLPRKVPYQIIPVLAHGKGLTRWQSNTLHKSKKYGKNSSEVRIKTIRCGAPLKNVF